MAEATSEDMLRYFEVIVVACNAVLR